MTYLYFLFCDLFPFQTLRCLCTKLNKCFFFCRNETILFSSCFSTLSQLGGKKGAVSHQTICSVINLPSNILCSVQGLYLVLKTWKSLLHLGTFYYVYFPLSHTHKCNHPVLIVAARASVSLCHIGKWKEQESWEGGRLRCFDTW